MPKKASTPRRAAPTALLTRVPKGKRRVPIAYSKALADQILDRIASGERWKTMSEAEGGLPHFSTLHRWARRDPEFAAAWVLAKRAGADWRADKVLDVAEAATVETLQVDRLHVGSLKWHVDRDTKLHFGRADEPDLGAGRKLIIEVRRFERYTDDDGVVRVRELLPPPSSADGAA